MKTIAIPFIPHTLRVPRIPKIPFTATQQSYACLALLVAAIAAYLYFLNVSVVHVVMRKEAMQEANSLRADIATLETSYIEAQHKISKKIAETDGFKRDNEKIFVTRGQSTLVLGNN